ncbi:uncharacterized protein A4U43_C03F29360 [Asparagus officinalis]|uniref:Uncharacterized protein n=1 Tax=Asparagus officinalis TaxID=4686 RepID=A0A5P1FFP7_ASPOF|nr:chlorophyllase-2, chloroplastic-like [Asparagus officinalis]ONK76543.1 uncharacterized protein A4U43_C03F29360 [Asparagus officinalis]
MSLPCGVFDLGKYTVDSKTVPEKDRSNPSGPNKPLLIKYPTDGEETKFPVVLLLHGYLLVNSFYSQLMHHVASHGFIVIAPQLYSIACLDCEGEIQSAATLTDWLIDNLAPALPGIKPNLNKLVISGHSRGGKDAFALALGLAKTKLEFSALIGICPVDGPLGGIQTFPPVLTHNPHSFDLNMPTLVIGSGLGGVPRISCLNWPCAPKGLSHEEFFKECRAPSWYFVGNEYGHMDVLDDETEGLKGIISNCTCKNGKERKPMRLFVGGVMVAFIRGYLDGDKKDLEAIRDDPKLAPIEFSVATR